jgi:NAD(P)-dependent dehydrogenase (short-subunit alcohol dehydrogenase family)
MTRSATAGDLPDNADGCSRPHSLITGTSTGIGRATALRLAALGHHVYAGVRHSADSPRLPDSSPGTITPITLDVTNSAHIEAAADLVDEHTGGAGLDALINNAGVAVSWPLELVPVDLFRQQLEVNVTGQLAVIQAFLPAVRHARGTIVVVGSVGGRITLPFAGPLNASKSAVAALAGSLRQEVAPSGVTVVLVEPGSIRTEAVDKLEQDARAALAAFPPQGRALYGQPYTATTQAALRRERHGSAPSVVADVIARAIHAPHPPARLLVGTDARLLAAAARLPTRLLDALRLKALGLR